MEEIPHREYVSWQLYLQEDWNKPSRSDNYLMLIAYAVANVLKKKPKPFSSKRFRLKFTFGGTKPNKAEKTEDEKKAYLKRSRGSWFGALGIGKKK